MKTLLDISELCVPIIYHNFSNIDVAILSLWNLVVAIEFAFSNEAKPLGLQVSLINTKVQDFGDLLGEVYIP